MEMNNNEIGPFMVELAQLTREGFKLTNERLDGVEETVVGFDSV